MRFDGVKRISKTNTMRVLRSLRLINRHALALAPLLLLTFAVIAGRVAPEFGMHYLFRDPDPLHLLGYFGLCDGFPCFLKSARFTTALYSTSLMGMVWTMFVLIERRDDDRSDRHPIHEFEPVLPGVVLLGLVMVGATLLNKEEAESYLTVLLLSGLGFAAGLLVVSLVTWLGLLASQRIRCHQVWTFLLLSACVALVVASLPLITPSKAIFITLSGAVVIYCLFELARAHLRFLLAAGIVAFLVVGAGLPGFKYEFPGLESYYNDYRKNGPPKLDAPAPVAPAAPLLDARRTLEAWLGQQPTSGPRKLVIVAASGGAYRAAFWTAKVLDCLTGDPDLPGFDSAIRLMTGASGGMVGLAYFVASRQPPTATGSKTGQRCSGAGPSSVLSSMGAVEAGLHADLAKQGSKIWVVNSKTDSLTPIVQRLINNDMPSAFWPIVNRSDRGKVLEEQWETLQHTFHDLEPGEREGWRPSLIVSPYLVDWARPMFITNLDLDGVIDKNFALEFFREFPKAREGFKLATAVRMNAAFPFISPAVRLPLDKRPRVVDAGYFDNFGITSAAMFLRQKAVKDFIQENNLQVVLIRILAFPQQAEASTEERGQAGTWADALWDVSSRLLEPWTSPLEGALAARETRGRFANELLLQDMKRTYATNFHDFTFVNTTQASFSWHIQAKELEKLRDSMLNAHNQAELSRLLEVWGKPRS